MVGSILSSFGLEEGTTSVETFGTGLINHTWKVTGKNEKFILQKVNDRIFESPEDIAQNIRLLKEYLSLHHPDYHFAAPLSSPDGADLIYVKDQGFFRLFNFVKGSHSKDVVETPRQAYEAARQFGRFTRLLAGFDVSELKITIPQFHDLNLRYQQFLNAIENGNKDRIKESQALIETLSSHKDIVDTYRKIQSNPAFKLRVMHHDTKISNVLFDAADQGLCVIDLDTVMPGYFISDVGDMMRTYLSPANEEEQDLSKISIREDIFHAIAEGYCSEMENELTEEEKQHFVYAGKFMIYMQALRFLTDHLNDDVYYGAKYEGHNFKRALNQSVLLQRLEEKEKLLKAHIPF